MKNVNIIEEFYKAFHEGDPVRMESFYDKAIQFEDPAFGQLKGKEAALAKVEEKLKELEALIKSKTGNQ